MKLQFLSILLAVVLTTGLASNQHLICKSVNDVFSEASGEPNGPRIKNGTRWSQGKPGKRGAIGPRGLPGARGSKGDAGYVDYNNISEIVEQKVCQGLASVISRLDDMRDAISEEFQQKQRVIQCSVTNGHLYNGTCYSAPEYSSSRHMNRAQGLLACQKIGYELARILDKTQQQALEDFLRPRVPSGDIVLWLDMTYDIATSTLRYGSGEEVLPGEVTWYPGYPQPGASKTGIMLGVKKIDESDGIWNYLQNYKANGVLCERALAV